jgi:hypothetical protein
MLEHWMLGLKCSKVILTAVNFENFENVILQLVLSQL